MLKERSLTIRLDAKLHKAARLKSVEIEKSLSQIMRDLLVGWVDGTVQLPETQQAQTKRKQKDESIE